MAPGSGFTVTASMEKQPNVDVVYVIMEVPAATPETSPPEVMVAILVLPLAHVPPGVISLRLVVPPTHTAAVPKGVVGGGFTVMTEVT
jgi:hypothetical protein